MKQGRRGVMVVVTKEEKEGSEEAEHSEEKNKEKS